MRLAGDGAASGGVARGIGATAMALDGGVGFGAGTAAVTVFGAGSCGCE